MNEKKVVVFIVEGPSDEAALGSVMKEYFSDNEVRFIVVHGDITLQDYVSVENIVSKIHEKLTMIRSRYRYEYGDFLKIIHLADMDGVYIPEEAVHTEDVDHVLYYTDHIGTRNTDLIKRRNKMKGEILFKLRKTGKVHDIPYRVYYNSCNLEHVLYGELKDFTDEEKEIMADDFADTYEGKVTEFVEFISDSSVAVSGTYQKTWDFMETGLNSLNRHSNMHLIFDSERSGKTHENHYFTSKENAPEGQSAMAGPAAFSGADGRTEAVHTGAFL